MALACSEVWVALAKSDAVLQKTLDYTCGAGADCSTILQNGACYNPNTVKAHCYYATNSYFQSNGEAQGACDFFGTATRSTTDPSYSGCTYPHRAPPRTIVSLWIHTKKRNRLDANRFGYWLLIHNAL
ncbi:PLASMODESMATA CALLOSE-BINDING PROTEIN 3-like [Zingiber officinale]|uniref:PLASMODESMATA CALLOSE-BINDING PROTEIN 3-like n=1 Tax=Zingiber officinale TaxID=94328 RepID=UPI001C4AA3F1|nr:PLASMODESMATA CALLOSE-BINDING PROTEIN 3-like [Zingiber officinale]